jgi:AbrB family looped-hinge helix DNA binding protein
LPEGHGIVQCDRLNEFFLLDRRHEVSNTYFVTATLSTRGQIVIPQEVRERCGLREGDHFTVEDNPSTQMVILKKVKAPGDWFDVYMECPGSFEMPPRRKQFYRGKHGLAD